MHTQRLLWTALPNGLRADGRRLRVSVLLSPRLVNTDDPDAVLSSFPDLLAWPAVARGARYEVVLNGLTVPAELVSAPDDGVWRRVFPDETPVSPRAFEDRRGTTVLSFPVAGVERDIADLYGRLAAEADGELPLLDDMRGRFGALGRGLRALGEEQLLQQLRTRDVDPAEADPVRRLSLANLYHTPLAAKETKTFAPTDPDDPREEVSWTTHALAPLPAPHSFRRTVDFHARVSALGHHPDLMRATGIVLDLEVDRDKVPDGAGTLAVLVTWVSQPETAVLGVGLEPDVLPRTSILLREDRFEARSRTPADPPVVDGHLVLADRGFDVVQLDVNGSALKVRQFAIGMFQAPAGLPSDADDAKVPDPVATPADRTGAPALRSGGLTLAMRGRAKDLTARFASSGAMEDALAAGTEPLLFAEDLVRGFRPEVLDDATGAWRSLVRRDTQVTFLSDLESLDVEDNEGVVRLAASSAADGSHPDVVKLYEGLFTWSGWSLAAPPVGRTVARDDSVTDSASVAPDGLPLEVEHRVRARSLPSLRYGRRYRARVRVVDLAGNALPFDPDRPSPSRAETEDAEYLRYEPIEAPTLALVGTGAAAEHPSYGEDLATAAIRSLNDKPADNDIPTTQVVRRHVVPPLSAQQLAERHGMLDFAGRVDATTYAMLASRDAALPEAVHPVTAKGFPAVAPGAGLPFLPDPLARDLVVYLAGRLGPGSVEEVRASWFGVGSVWPDARPLRIEAYEPADPAAVPELDPASGVLRVPLAKADHLRLRVSHMLSDEALRLFGMWRWAAAHLPADPAARDALQELVRTGRHWMFTPWRDLELVHAVQRPLVTPELRQLTASRPLGTTVAQLRFATPVDSRSTVKLEMFGRWLDPIDDPAQDGPRARVGGGARAAELPLRRLEAPGVDPPGTQQWLRRPVTHEFGDTRYRRVGYRLTGTTRFTRFLPPPLQEPGHADDLTVTSEEAVTWIPSSAPPPAPDVVYVMPTFGWSRTLDGVSGRSWRGGGGLRVYLRRPWLTSGYMEMLGVVLPQAGTPAPDPKAAAFLTQWGADPTWGASGVPGSAPASGRFALAVTEGPIAQARLDSVIPDREGELPAGPFELTGLPLPGVPAPTTVDVAPHLVRWDPERRLWYADLVIEPGESYTPFIRLALARYQPVSAPGAHLSTVAVTEVVQLLPDRLLTLTRMTESSYQIAVYGTGPEQGRNQVEVQVERALTGAGDLAWTDLEGVRIRDVPQRPDLPERQDLPGRPDMPRGPSWHDVADKLIGEHRFDELLQRLDLLDLLRPPLLRNLEVHMPRKSAEGERFRLVVTEWEVRSVDPHQLKPAPPPGRDPRRRPVYVETVDLV
jgi:hypothetical protein